MAPRQPHEKDKILDDISNDILNNHLESQSGLYKVDKIKMRKYLREADTNKSGNYATYHYIQALIHIANLRYNKAKGSFLTALKNAPNNVTIMGNYSALLVNTNEFDEAYKLICTLIKSHKVYEKAIMNNLYRMALSTLNTSYFDDFSDDSIVTEYLGFTRQLDDLHRDISKVDISLEEYIEFMKLLSSFVLNETRQNFKPRFSIIEGLDRYLTVEVFLDVNLEEASYLNSEFTDYFMNYIFENEHHNLLGKFAVFFKQKKSRYDGTINPDDLYLGIDEELVA